METDIPTASNQSVTFTSVFNASCRFDEEFKYVLLPVSYTLVFLVGLTLNAVALWTFVKMRPWNPSAVLMFHLALSDLLILLLTCISVYRYMGICHPIKALTLVKSRHAHLVCAAVWAAVAICLVPNLMFVTTSRRDNDTLCHDTTRQDSFEEYVDYSSAVMVLLFGVPFLVIVVCYCLMARTLCRRRRGLSANPASRHKSIKLIVVVLIVFAVSFVPFHITRTIYYTARVLDLDCRTLNIVNFTYKITRPLASVNSCIDPVLYFLAGDHYRAKLLSALTGRRRLTRSQAHTQTPVHRSPTIALVYKSLDAKTNSEAQKL
ncbi:P2Y purinoceptor 4 isoform X2 [Phyllopteryx taeniolatus]|uniref:P2Y purinoceptor 4 isoform X2 n=1 Tax=Phyllopteryx taeniolatus TaxID=161469 RepID=UPI002AD5784D|nr:P2Y purinoceptor 4 isoform X2 [Phyllopteryx taeniolatus]